VCRSPGRLLVVLRLGGTEHLHHIKPGTNTGRRQPRWCPARLPLDIDVVAPLVITTIGPDPIPVTGTDGKVHVAYELSVLNSGPRPATITKVDTLADGPEGAAVATIGQQETVERTLLIPNLLPDPVTEILAGRTAVLVLDDVYDSRGKVPADVTHRLAVTLGRATPEYQPAVSARYPDSVTQIGGEVRASAASPILIGPPLAGDDWVAGNACCIVSPHRGAVMGVGGRLNGSERYAIDWLRIDPATNPATTHTGDGTRNEDYLAYDAPLLAVADGTVAAVVSANKEATPRVITPNQAFEELGGNYAIIDIGDRNFAFYAHMLPGSASVKVGDKVTRGQVIGHLGNSGNTTEAHLHFHVMRAQFHCPATTCRSRSTGSPSSVRSTASASCQKQSPASVQTSCPSHGMSSTSHPLPSGTASGWNRLSYSDIRSREAH
jgi:murein DD-endopeptidase MepM/ murein hydrolase activator NlpD